MGVQVERSEIRLLTDRGAAKVRLSTDPSQGVSKYKFIMEKILKTILLNPQIQYKVLFTFFSFLLLMISSLSAQQDSLRANSLETDSIPTYKFESDTLKSGNKDRRLGIIGFHFKGGTNKIKFEDIEAQRTSIFGIGVDFLFPVKLNFTEFAAGLELEFNRVHNRWLHIKEIKQYQIPISLKAYLPSPPHDGLFVKVGFFYNLNSRFFDYTKSYEAVKLENQHGILIALGSDYMLTWEFRINIYPDNSDNQMVERIIGDKLIHQTQMTIGLMSLFSL
ncbi:MAG: hypothetical protein IIB94_14425 [Candidatus Marinimicrobia bacterium]|nr:hypothetical protein [Candidatus Neomarinimicrobiota bacterium]